MKKTITMLLTCLLLMCSVAGVTAFFNQTDDAGYFTTLASIVKSNVINVYAVVSFVLGAIDYVIILLTGKEAPKVRSVWLGVLLFTQSFLYQCISDMMPGFSKEVGAVGIIVVTVLFHIYILFLDQKSKSKAVANENIQVTEIKESTSEKALVKFAKRNIRTCHEAITSIQLYKVVKNESNQEISYDIEYLDSGHRNDPSLNAVLNARLSITKEKYDLFQPFLNAFEEYLSAQNSAAETTRVLTMEVLSKDNISKIKDELTSHINTVSDITIEDCCSSRLVLTYLSCLARIGKENAGDYVGVRCQSLNVCSDSKEKNEINKHLFSKFRTGLLGALLLRNRPYVFYYEREDNNAKANRQYISFQLHHENARNSYLILITANQKTESEGFLHSLLGSIKSIQEECNRLYLKHEVKQNVNT